MLFRFPKNFKKIAPKQLLKVYQTLRSAHGHLHWWPGETPFEIIIGAILTQNTSWSNVEKAIINLKKHKALTPSALKKIPMNQLATLIRSAGYFNVKAQRIKEFIHFLYSRYNGKLDAMFQTPLGALRHELLGVKGIGPETADSILLYAGGKRTFVIDAYTKRIFSRHGLGDVNADYSHWQQLFEKSLPPKTGLYNDFHAQIVHTGKFHCRTAPQCDTCPLKTYF